MGFFITSNENHEGNTRTNFKNVIPRDYIFNNDDPIYISLKKIEFQLNFPTIAKRNTPHIVTVILEDQVKNKNILDFPILFQKSNSFKLFHKICNNKIEWRSNELNIEIEELEYNSQIKEIEIYLICDVILGCVVILTYIDDLRMVGNPKSFIKILNGIHKLYQLSNCIREADDNLINLLFKYPTFLSNEIIKTLGFDEDKLNHKVNFIDFPLYNVMNNESSFMRKLSHICYDFGHKVIELSLDQPVYSTIRISFILNEYPKLNNSDNVLKFSSKIKINVVFSESSEVNLPIKNLRDISKNINKEVNDKISKYISSGYIHDNPFKSTPFINIRLTKKNKTEIKLYNTGKYKKISILFDPNLRYYLGIKSRSPNIYTKFKEYNDDKILYSDYSVRFYAMRQNILANKYNINLNQYITSNVPFYFIFCLLIESYADVDNNNQPIYSYVDTNSKYYYFKSKTEYIPKHHLNTNSNAPKLIFIESSFTFPTSYGNQMKRILNYFPVIRKSEYYDLQHTFLAPIQLHSEKNCSLQISLLDEKFDPVVAATGAPTVLYLDKSNIMKNTYTIYLDSSDQTSKQLYTENSNNRFRNKLAVPLNVYQKDRWSVNLKSIAMPKVKNIYSHHTEVSIGETQIRLDDMYCSNFPFFINELNSKIRDVVKKNNISNDSRSGAPFSHITPRFSYNNETGIVSFTAGSERDIKISPPLCYMLGLSHSLRTEPLIFNNILADPDDYLTEIVGTIPAALNYFLPKSCMILCDIVEESVFAQQRPQVLKFCKLENDLTDETNYTHLEFLENDFVNLKHGKISEIKVMLVDLNGDLLQFVEENDVKMCLQFVSHDTT